MERQLEIEELQRAKEEVRKLQEEAHKQVEDANKQVEKKNQEIKQMIQLMLTNGMSLEFISKSLSKSEDEIRDLLG
jgi:N-acetylmuramic acid 6-phosphate (MurNAc-6-P) etherase